MSTAATRVSVGFLLKTRGAAPPALATQETLPPPRAVPYTNRCRFLKPFGEDEIKCLGVVPPFVGCVPRSPAGGNLGLSARGRSRETSAGISRVNNLRSANFKPEMAMIQRVRVGDDPVV